MSTDAWTPTDLDSGEYRALLFCDSLKNISIVANRSKYWHPSIPIDKPCKKGYCFVNKSLAFENISGKFWKNMLMKYIILLKIFIWTKWFVYSNKINITITEMYKIFIRLEKYFHFNTNSNHPLFFYVWGLQIQILEISYLLSDDVSVLF